MSSVLVARFAGRIEVAPVVRAALDIEIVYVALPEPPPPGRHTLQLVVAGELVGAVSCELVGSGRDGTYPLRVSLLDPAHTAEMEVLAERTPQPPKGGERHYSSGSMPAAVGPRPSRKSIRQAELAAEAEVPAPRAPIPHPAAHEDRTLASRADVIAAGGLKRRRVSVVESAPPPPPEEPVAEGEIVATTVFDPESVLRARAVHKGTASEDLTLPISAPSAAPSPPRPRADFFTDDEFQTLPGASSSERGTTEVSWNVRIAPTTKDPLCGRIISGGKYVLDSVIGTGAIGIVFKASHRDLGRTVAIKVLNPRYRDDPDLMEVFRREARAASLLEHPNVARVYDYGHEPDGLVYIVMEYLSGYTLGSVLDARRKLTAARAVDVMIQVCAGLAAAHERDIIHRDVKPDNIVLVPSQDDEGTPVEIVKVCDFGIASLATTRIEEGTEAMAAGTPEYMSPEQTLGSASSPSSDVYACGVVLYQLLAGQVPFSADQAYRILMKHRSEAPRRPSTLAPGIDPALEAIVMRCMEKSPARRYQSARELRVELRKVAEPKAL